MQQKIISFIIAFFMMTSAFAQNRGSLMNDTLWTYAIKGYPVEIPLIGQDAIYLGADVSPLTCIDKRTGKEKWRMKERSAGKGFVHTISQDDEGIMYANGISKNLLAVRKSDGKLLWSYECSFDDDLFSVITVSEKVLYVNPAAPEFIALNTDGSLRWKTELPDVCRSYLIHKSNIYCQLGDGTYLLNKSDGKARKIISAASSPGNRSPFPPVCTSNKILVHHNDSLTCYDTKKFRQDWTVGNILGFCFAGDQLFAYSGDHFKKINARNGKTVWEQAGKFSWYIQPVVHRSSVYIQARYHFYVLDAESGELQYTSAFPYKSYTRPTVEDDKIYIGIGGKFICVKNPVTKKKQ